MNNILAACLLSSLIACSLDDPYMPVNPEEKPAPRMAFVCHSLRRDILWQR